MLSEITRLSPLVVRVLGLNPGPFTLQGTNTYLVGRGSTRILIDAGEGRPGYLPLLLRAIRQAGAESLSDVIITHYHHDHSEGLRDLQRHFGPSLRAWKAQPLFEGPHGPSFSLKDVLALEDAQRLKAADGSATLRIVFTPGHTKDHVCLLLEEEGSLFAGTSLSAL